MDHALRVREGDGVADLLEEAQPLREAAALARVLVQAGLAHLLDRHLAAQALILGQVHRAEATAAQ